ncbi:12173_t:CDS:2, partial [Racocetra fulgida]
MGDPEDEIVDMDLDSDSETSKTCKNPEFVKYHCKSKSCQDSSTNANFNVNQDSLNIQPRSNNPLSVFGNNRSTNLNVSPTSEAHKEICPPSVSADLEKTELSSKVIPSPDQNTKIMDLDFKPSIASLSNN